MRDPGQIWDLERLCVGVLMAHSEGALGSMGLQATYGCDSVMLGKPSSVLLIWDRF